jgi:hypothetical protein
MAKTKSGAKDARFRHREPVIWHGVRTETFRHVRHGEGFVRPDLCFWIDGHTPRASGTVTPDASHAVLAELLDEALAADPRRTPTELVVATPELAGALRTRFGDRFTLRVRAERQLPAAVLGARDARGSDLHDPPRSNLDRGTATADAVSGVHTDMVGLTSDPRLATPSAAALCFTLRAPQLGWSVSSVWLHGTTPRVTLTRTHDDGRGRTPWRGSPRLPETRTLEVSFEEVAAESVRAEEADQHGWRDPRDPSRALTLRAKDVAFIPRPLSGEDVAVLATAVSALRAWLVAHGDPFERIAPGTAAKTREVELIFEERTVDPSAPLDLAAAFWCDIALPRSGAPEAVSTKAVERVRGMLLGAVPPARLATAQALAAEGAETVSALLAWLDDDALWESTNDVPWMIPWVLAALIQSGDPRVPGAVLRVLVTRVADLDDFVFEGLPVTLAAMGPSAIDTLASVLRGDPLDRYLRLAAGEALYRIGVEHPATRERVADAFAALYAGLRGGVDGDAFLASALSAEAARMRAPHVDAEVRAAHALEIWDEGFVEFESWDAEQREAPWSVGGAIGAGSLDALLAEPWWKP